MGFLADPHGHTSSINEDLLTEVPVGLLVPQTAPKHVPQIGQNPLPVSLPVPCPQYFPNYPQILPDRRQTPPGRPDPQQPFPQPPRPTHNPQHQPLDLATAPIVHLQQIPPHSLVPDTLQLGQLQQQQGADLGGEGAGLQGGQVVRQERWVLGVRPERLQGGLRGLDGLLDGVGMGGWGQQGLEGLGQF